MGLNPDNEYEFGAYAFFNIRNNDLLIAASEKIALCCSASFRKLGIYCANGVLR